MGFVHSHPGLRRLSEGDLSYVRRILRAIPDLDRLLVPIVIPSTDGGRFEILPYAVAPGADGELVVDSPQILAVDKDGCAVNDWESALAGDADGVHKPDARATVKVTVSVRTYAGPVVSETFRRVAHAYDLDLMRSSRVIYVGAGGAAGFIEDLARAGVGEHVLIDPDVVTESNLATQQTYRRDLGRPKVDAITERVRDINSDALVVTLKRSLDEIGDREFEFYATARSERWHAERTVICGLTDDFYAQARVNRLALQHGIASLCAQVYREGRGAEITFTHPDVTPACHRCVLSARYRAYLENGYTNTVTSDGTPIFATTRLNALKGFVVLALLHHGSTHPRWGNLLSRLGKRNLVQIRLDPDIAGHLGLGVFDRVFEKAQGERIVFDEAVWLPQDPEGSAPGSSPCPDCGGAGNLRECVGTIPDTRVIRK